MDAIFTGIVAGLVTGILIWFFREIWLKILEPKIENYLYSDVRIDGAWVSELTAKAPHREEIQLHQKGHRIEGTMKCIEGQGKGASYMFSGTFRNLILTAAYISTNAEAVDRGTFTLKLRNNGTRFEGATSYYRDTDDSISTTDYAWNKGS